MARTNLVPRVFSLSNMAAVGERPVFSRRSAILKIVEEKALGTSYGEDDMDFDKDWKNVRMSVQSFFKIIEILPKCCCSVDFLRVIAFNHLVRAN